MATLTRRFQALGVSEAMAIHGSKPASAGGGKGGDGRTLSSQTMSERIADAHEFSTCPLSWTSAAKPGGACARNRSKYLNLQTDTYSNGDGMAMISRTSKSDHHV